MQRPILFLIIFFCFSFLEAEEKKTVLVSLAPYRHFVQKIAQDAVDIQLLVPKESSSHTFDPTPKQVVNAFKGEVLFRIGETFEDKMIPILQSKNKNFKVVDLRSGIKMIGGEGHKGCCHAHGYDVHTWLSVELVKIQVKTIAIALAELLPEKKEFFMKNLALYEKELTELHEEIKATFQGIDKKTFFVSHPAYAYFARDYGLVQISLEVEGKDPTPREIESLLALVKKEIPSTIFVQPQYSQKAAEVVAEKLHLKLVLLNPYEEEYEKSLKDISCSIASSLKGK